MQNLAPINEDLDLITRLYADSRYPVFNVKDYGAIGNGTADDRPAIQSANDAAEAAGGGIVYYPKGTYLLDSDVGDVCINIDANDVFHVGQGRGVSIVKLANTEDAHMYNFSSVVGGGMKSLELDGNRTNQTAGVHCIRAESIDSVIFDDLYIHDAETYGIGLQEGTIENCIISNTTITDTGGDGIDVKNLEDNNLYNKIDNVTVLRFGLNVALEAQAGIDLRGQWTLSNIHVAEFESASAVTPVGVRFRSGENGDSTGYGAHDSSMSNFFIQGSDENDTIGINSDAYRVQLSNGIVKDCSIGYNFRQTENIVSNCIALSCGTGFLCQESGLPSQADRTFFSNCIGTCVVSREVKWRSEDNLS